MVSWGGPDAAPALRPGDVVRVFHDPGGARKRQAGVAVLWKFLERMLGGLERWEATYQEELEADGWPKTDRAVVVVRSRDVAVHPEDLLHRLQPSQGAGPSEPGTPPILSARGAS